MKNKLYFKLVFISLVSVLCVNTSFAKSNSTENDILNNSNIVSDSGAAYFDFGTSDSPLESGYTRITQKSKNWKNSSGIDSRLRGLGPNNINRDLIFSKSAGTFEHDVPNGTYKVTVTFGDRDYARSGQVVKAEGKKKASNISTGENEFISKSFKTKVKDGKLSLEFSATNGVWCVTGVTIVPTSVKKNQNSVVDTNPLVTSYDFGTGDSPLESGYTRITPSSNNWTISTNLEGRLREAGSNIINRDFIFSKNSRTFEHTTENGVYDVIVTFGDNDYARTGQAIKAEGKQVISSVNTAKAQFQDATFQTSVNDGNLSLQFSATDGVWCVTRVVITQVSKSKGSSSKRKSEKKRRKSRINRI